MTEFKGRRAAIVVVDWARCARANLWKEELQNLSPSHVDFAKCTWLPLADSPVLRHDLRDRQVLIFNFDSINGDPACGSDFALNWVQLHHKSLLRWVTKGGILILEGQAMLSVPTQASYDALFGHREMRVSRPSEGTQALEWKRTGPNCRVTANARKLNLLNEFDKFACKPGLSLASRFPGLASDIVGDDEHDKGSWSILYRGWFSRIPILTRQHRWTPLIETDQSHSTNHPVLVGTQIGEGVIFLSTMFLAGTGPSQSQLIGTLIGWDPKEHPLPSEKPLVSRIRALLEPTVKLLISIAAARLTAGLLKPGVVLQGVLIQFFLWAMLTVVWLVILALASWSWKKTLDFLGV